MRSDGGLLKSIGSKLALLKSTFNAKNFICRLSLVISTQCILEMYVAATNLEKSLKIPILGFKVIQGHRCWYLRKARQHCLL